MKKYKRSIFAAIMIAITLVTSMSVWAKERSEEVALNGAMGAATIGIEDDGLYAWAYTSGSTAYNEIAQTRIYGGGPDPFSGVGVSSAQVSARYEAFTYAESSHLWTGRSYTMYIAP